MPLKPPQSVSALLLVFGLVSAGCSARRLVAGIEPPFRLGSVYGQPVLFAPSTPETNPNSSGIGVKLEVPSHVASTGADCLAVNGPFHVQMAGKQPASVQIILPSPERWISDFHGLIGPEGDAGADLYGVLAKLDRLQRAGCFGEDDSVIRDFILQSLPIEPRESLFSYYGYRPNRSGLDLRLGMRLKIQRAYLRDSKDGEEGQASAGSGGVSLLYFNVESESDEKIQFRRAGDVRFTPRALGREFRNTGLEMELAGIPVERNYRLVFYTLLVSKEQKLATAVLGASTSSQLDEMDAKLRLRPEDGCKNFSGMEGVACLEFKGLVTVTGQIRVQLNGKSKFVDCGTSVKDLVQENALASLRIQRKFMSSYRDVRFKPGDPDILPLALVAGDRLMWTQTASNPL